MKERTEFVLGSESVAACYEAAVAVVAVGCCCAELTYEGPPGFWYGFILWDDGGFLDRF